MYFLYTLALTVGLLLIFPYYLVRFRKYLPTVPDRFGFVKLPQIRLIVHAIPAGAPLVGPRVQRVHDHGNAIRDRPAKDRSHRSRSAEGDRLWKSQIRRRCRWQTARRQT